MDMSKVGDLYIGEREEWNAAFLLVAIECGYGEMDPEDEAWDEYFDLGYTPEEAIQADLQAGGADL